MTWEYSQRNHLFAAPVKASATANRLAPPSFLTKIGVCERKPESGLEESSRAARYIADHFPSPIVLCMSGGVDSEAMARAFLAARVPFEGAIANYSPDRLNADDIDEAIAFCEANRVRYRIYDINLVEFFGAYRHIDFALWYQCRSPQLAVHLHLLERIAGSGQGTPILGWNPTEIRFDEGTKKPRLLLPAEPHCCYLRYFQRTGRPGVPFFFAYSPEQIYSFWTTPQFDLDLGAATARFEAALAGQDFQPSDVEVSSSLNKTSYISKVRKYQQAGFQIEARSDKKTGFENAKLFFRDHFLAKKAISTDFPHEVFNHFFRRPLEDMNPYPDAQLVAVPSNFFPRPDLLKTWYGPDREERWQN